MSDTMFSQDDVNRLVGIARMEARDKARKEFTEEVQTHKDYESQIEELKGQVGTYKEKYDEIMNGALESTLSDLSEDVRKLVDDYPGTVDDKLAWIEKYKEVLNVKPGGGVGNRGTPPAKIKDYKTNYKPRTGL